MEASNFVAPQWGRAVSTGGAHAYVAFQPAQLPRSLILEPQTIKALSAADASMGRLAGAGRLLPAPHLLLLPSLRREALASSRIEGTQASLSDVFEAEASGAPRNEDVREVTNYMAAMDHGLARLEALPLSKRLMREMHAVLLTGVRGQEKTPGEFRHSQNWIGAVEPSTAVFVPPTVEHMMPALDDWELYAHDEEPELPLLIRTALLHYQFETIHPFLDGNGRLGRLFIVLYLVERAALPSPLLPLSPYLERYRSDYYSRLQAVRERGEIQAWLRFFLAAVEVQANDAVSRAERLLDLREKYRVALRGTRSRAVEVVDLMLSSPVMQTRQVADRLEVTIQGATYLLKQLSDAGVLRPQTQGKGTPVTWYADEVLEVLAD
ncbi:Fic family protein [Blastococcus capsensis]|uniref:Fic family protein n=1 Tax=Blastococcus capsensis TaxID=1564163 RepID=UPI00254131CE|nr:Fic/DOC family N-terminal domain-containing protein [Blastococcus capsensis]MDK3258355.1 Fic/DOC family N-terminal domain-containing protein [Blastococcus capsensis]